MTVMLRQPGETMSILTVTARGQVTFRKEALKHLGILPGGKIRLDLLPNGRAELKANRARGSLHEFRGVLKSGTNGARPSSRKPVTRWPKPARRPGWASGEDTADTNVLPRAALADDEPQRQVAIETLKSAEVVAISVQSFCEFAWILDGDIRRHVRISLLRSAVCSKCAISW